MEPCDFKFNPSAWSPVPETELAAAWTGATAGHADNPRAVPAVRLMGVAERLPLLYPDGDGTVQRRLPPRANPALRLTRAEPLIQSKTAGIEQAKGCATHSFYTNSK